MEVMKKNQPIINLLVSTKLVLYTVLEYLDSSALTNLHISFQNGVNNKYASILAILQSYLYIRLHMINTDRSYYYFVYESLRFRKIQKLTIAFLVQSNNKFNRLFALREQRKVFLKSLLTEPNCEQIAYQIQQVSNNPQIPMMRLLRETVGVGCTSIFQNYLISLGDQNYSMLAEEYPNLSEFYQKRTNQSYINQFFKIGRSKGKHQNFEKVKRLRLAPYLISCDDEKLYRLPDNELHNFLIALFATADQMVQAAGIYVRAIQDPYHQFMEFCLRYSIYRNFVLSIQDKYGFIFEIYQSIYQETFKNESIDPPQFSFWRPALSKWVMYMSEFHQGCTKVHNYLIINKRHKNLVDYFQSIPFQQTESDQLTVRNWINLVSVEKFQNFFKKPPNKQIFQIIQQQLDFCINQYNEYQIDMSIDQVLVNWCGHSKQRLGLPYIEFQIQTIQSNRLYIQELINSNCNPKTLIKIFQNDLSFILNNQLYRQKIFSQVVQESKRITRIVSNNNLELKYSYQNLDERIELANQKAQIPEQMNQGQSRKFYQICPLKYDEVSKYIEKDTVQTMGGPQQSLQNQQFDYVSERNDHSQFNEIECTQRENLQYLMRDQSDQPIESECQEKEEQNLSSQMKLYRQIK